MPGRDVDDLQREIDAHIALETDRLIAEGLAAPMARDAAIRRFGNRTRVQERFYESRRILRLDRLRQDARYALRSFRRSPAFAAVAVLTLALAIGLNTSIFSIVDGLLLRPLALPNADRLVRVFETNQSEGQTRGAASQWNFADWRQRSRSFSALAAYSARSIPFAGEAEPESVVAMVVTRDFFPAVGGRIALGRAFQPEEFESLANAAFAPVSPPGFEGVASVIISHSLWQRQFGGQPDAMGKRVALNGIPAVVVGVTAPDSTFDETALGTADCWIPLVESVDRHLPSANLRRLRLFTVIGLLKPEVGLESARAELQSVADRLSREHPAENAGWSVDIVTLQESLLGDARRVLLFLLAGVACVLIIACANVANLFLVRGTGRAREVAVRVALGASRGRLLGQWLTESTLLAAAGGGLGLALSFGLVPVLIRAAPATLPRLDTITVDARVLAFCAAISVAIGILSGLAPALTARQAGGTTTALRATTSLAAHRSLWLRHALAVVQVAFAIVLLVAAGLMTRTLANLHLLDLGFEPDGVLTFGVDLRGERYSTRPARVAFSRDLVARLQARPEVQVAGAGAVPLQVGVSLRFTNDDGVDIVSPVDVPTPGYFEALRFRLLHGRFFGDDDTAGSAAVVLVNRAFARALWHTDDVVGRRLLIGGSTPLTVVGVVGDARMTTLEAEPPPVAFMPLEQTRMVTYANYVVRTRGEPASAIPLVRSVIRELDPTLAVSRLSTMTERLSRVVAARAFTAWLIGLFSLVALTLAAVGLYAILSDTVASRTSEIGVRIALGARRAAVIRLVVGRIALVTAAGIVLGLAGAAAVVGSLESLLFGLAPLDAATFAAAPLSFVAAAVLAALRPARNAAFVDPVVALRCE